MEYPSVVDTVFLTKVKCSAHKIMVRLERGMRVVGGVLTLLLCYRLTSPLLINTITVPNFTQVTLCIFKCQHRNVMYHSLPPIAT